MTKHRYYRRQRKGDDRPFVQVDFPVQGGDSGVPSPEEWAWFLANSGLVVGAYQKVFRKNPASWGRNVAVQTMLGPAAETYAKVVRAYDPTHVGRSETEDKQKVSYTWLAYRNMLKSAVLRGNLAPGTVGRGNRTGTPVLLGDLTPVAPLPHRDDQDELHDRIVAAWRKLTRKRQHVVDMFFGLSGPALTVTEIAKRRHCTKQNVSLILRGAFRVLRREFGYAGARPLKLTVKRWRSKRKRPPEAPVRHSLDAPEKFGKYAH